MTHRAADAATERDVDVDVVVVGSGFGGSVTALRLAEKGYRVLVGTPGGVLRHPAHPPTA